MEIKFDSNDDKFCTILIGEVSPRKLCVILFDNSPTDTIVLPNHTEQSREEKNKLVFT